MSGEVALHNDQDHGGRTNNPSIKQDVDEPSRASDCSAAFGGNEELEYAMDIFKGSKGDLISCGIMTASSIIEMIRHYKSEEFDKLRNEAMELAFYDNALMESENGYDATFINPQSQVA